MRYLIVLLLAGCVSPQQRAANIVAHFGPICEGMGFIQGSDGWRQCILAMQPQSLPVPQAPIRTHCMPGPAGVTCITR